MFSDLIARARTVPIEREIDRRGIRLKRQGHEFVGRAPYAAVPIVSASTRSSRYGTAEAAGRAATSLLSAAHSRKQLPS
jgi:hypothetical protein